MVARGDAPQLERIMKNSRTGPMPALLSRYALPLALTVALSPAAAAQNTPSRPRPFAVTGVRLELAEDAPRKTLILRDGRIESIQDAALELPGDVWVLEVDGLLATPAFLDAWTRTGCEMPSPEVDQDRPAEVDANVRIDMRQANRKGIQPSFRAATAIAVEAKDIESHRSAGFGGMVSSPGGEILAGRSALLYARDAAPRDLIIKDGVFQHAAFSASGGGYPSTLMGYHAQLRQLFYDARRQVELEDRQEAGLPGPRPAWDDELEAAASILRGEELLVCEADSARDINRWLRLAKEFDLTIAIAGGRDAWKVADELARRDITVLMDLDWGDEVDDPDADEDADEEEEEGEEPDSDEEDADGEEPTEGDSDEEGSAEESASELNYEYEEPIGVRREKRRLWEERRDSATRLHQAGVDVVFCTGAREPDERIGSVRELVEAGFPRTAAIAALTTHAAEIAGAARYIGKLSAGESATFSLWTGDPMDDDSQVAWSFVEGFGNEFEVKERRKGGDGPAEGVDLSGAWAVAFPGDDDAREMELILEMDEDGSLSGSVSTTNPMDDSPLEADVEGYVEGNDVSFSMTFSVGGGFEVELDFDGEVEGDEITGTRTLKFPGSEDEARFEATREPDRGGKQ